MLDGSQGLDRRLLQQVGDCGLHVSDEDIVRHWTRDGGGGHDGRTKCKLCVWWWWWWWWMPKRQEEKGNEDVSIKRLQKCTGSRRENAGQR